MFKIVVRSGPFQSTVSEDHVATHWLIYWDGEVYVDKIVESGDLKTYTIDNPCNFFDSDFSRFPTFRVWVRYKGSKTGWSPWGWGAGEIVDILKMTESFDLGPVERNDTSKGLGIYRWREVLRPDGFHIYRENDLRTDWEHRAQLVDINNKDEVKNFNLTFDQNGRPVLVYERQGNVCLWWYDPRESSYILVDPLCEGSMPVARLDSRNPFHLSKGITDILIFYYNPSAGQFAYRIQSERYETEHLIPVDVCDPSGKILKFIEYTKNNRLAVVYIEEITDDYGPCYQFGAIISAMYPFTPVDSSSMKSAEILSGRREELYYSYESLVEASDITTVIVDGRREQVVGWYEVGKEIISWTSGEGWGQASSSDSDVADGNDIIILATSSDIKTPEIMSGRREQVIFWIEKESLNGLLADASDVKTPEITSGRREQVVWWVEEESLTGQLADASDCKTPNITGGSRHAV